MDSKKIQQGVTGWKTERWNLNMIRSPRVTNHYLRLMVALRNKEQMGMDGGPCEMGQPVSC